MRQESKNYPDTEELYVLKLVATLLSNHHILYMLSGSMATNFYAKPRMTRDIDVVISLQLKDVERVYNLFKDDFYIDRNSILQAVQSQGLFNVIHNKFVVKVDFIIRKDTKYRKTEFNRRRKIYIEKTDIYIVSAEDLILSKLFWAKDFRSSTQLTDVRNILESVKNLDMNYLKFWVRELKLEEIFDEALG